ncbi:unnamed protein product [Caenorhabditis bovis]|uniref:Innexin n=1 Tax=Caenorhabditis bovis TaxID=2654633 RepID=A0A8S1FDJ2_9PELO|nr:unnamed protein product [Caenorhabditis bovis]
MQSACRLDGVHAVPPESLPHGVRYSPKFTTYPTAPFYMLISAISYIIPKIFFVLILKALAFPLVYICGTAYLISWKAKEERKKELREIAITLRSRLRRNGSIRSYAIHYLLYKLGYLLNCAIQIIALPYFLGINFDSYWVYMITRPFSFLNPVKPDMFPDNGTCWINVTEYIKLLRVVPEQSVTCNLTINSGNELIFDIIGYYLIFITVITFIGNIRCYYELGNLSEYIKDVLSIELDAEQRHQEIIEMFLKSLGYDGYVTLYLVGCDNIFIKRELILQLYSDYVETHNELMESDKE